MLSLWTDGVPLYRAASAARLFVLGAANARCCDAVIASTVLLTGGGTLFANPPVPAGTCYSVCRYLLHLLLFPALTDADYAAIFGALGFCPSGSLLAEWAEAVTVYADELFEVGI